MRSALIVDDEPVANELLSMLVQLRGYQTDSAFTGNEALEKADRGRPDLIFLDLMLPDISGYEVCRALKAGRDTSGIPVVMVSARLADEGRLQGFRAGAMDFVPKPYTPDQIFASMAQADRWRDRFSACESAGAIPLDSRSDVAHLRDLSRLRSLLLGRTPLSESCLEGVDHALIDLADRAVEWGRLRQVDRVATLEYRCDPEGVVLTLLDESGWFVDDPPRWLEGVGGLIARGRFDEVAYNEAARHVVMTRLSSG